MKDSDVSQLLRGYARQLRAMRFRGTEQYLEQLDMLARSMERKASEIVHPAAITAEPGFLFPGEQLIRGVRVRVERRRRRIA